MRKCWASLAALHLHWLNYQDESDDHHMVMMGVMKNMDTRSTSKFFHCGACDFSKRYVFSMHGVHESCKVLYVSEECRLYLLISGLEEIIMTEKTCWCERNAHHCSWNKMHPTRLWTLPIEGAYSACTNYKYLFRLLDKSVSSLPVFLGL